MVLQKYWFWSKVSKNSQGKIKFLIQNFRRVHHWPQKQKKTQSTFLLTNLSISQVLYLRLKTVTYQIQNIDGKDTVAIISVSSYQHWMKLFLDDDNHMLNLWIGLHNFETMIRKIIILKHCYTMKNY